MLAEEALVDELCERVCARIHQANRSYRGSDESPSLNPKFDHLSAIFEFLKPGRYDPANLTRQETKIGPILMVAEVSAAILEHSEAEATPDYQSQPSPAFLRPDYPNAPIGLDGRTTLACLIYFLSSLSREPHLKIEPKTDHGQGETVEVIVEAGINNYSEVREILMRCINGVELSQSEDEKTVTLTLPRKLNDGQV